MTRTLIRARFRSVILLCCLVGITSTSAAQDFKIDEIDVLDGAASSNPSDAVELNGFLYFFATTDGSGTRSLVRFQATGALQLEQLADFAPPLAPPSELTAYAGKLFFRGQTSAGNNQLLQYDPVPDAVGALPLDNPAELTVSADGSRLALRGEGSNGPGVYGVDPTNSTIDFRYGCGAAGPAPFEISAGPTLTFVAQPRCLDATKLDVLAVGTSSTETVATDVDPSYLTAVGDTLFFRTGAGELYRYRTSLDNGVVSFGGESLVSPSELIVVGEHLALTIDQAGNRTVAIVNATTGASTISISLDQQSSNLRALAEPGVDVFAAGREFDATRNAYREYVIGDSGTLGFRSARPTHDNFAIPSGFVRFGFTTFFRGTASDMISRLRTADGLAQIILSPAEMRQHGSFVTLSGDADATVSGRELFVISGVCGDTTVDLGEACDDGNTTTEACAYGAESCMVCDATCQLVPGAISFCGDDTNDAPEECDDGNTETEVCDYGDEICEVCNASCELVAGETFVCGDGDIDAPNEACDDENTVTEACAYGAESCTVCDATCQEVAGETSLCGDGNVDTGSGEECDDNNVVTEVCEYGAESCEVCNASCELVAGETFVCGDGDVDAPAEMCDDNNTVTENCPFGADSCTVCDDTCQEVAGETSLCGDGNVDTGSGEECDDDNAVTEVCDYGAQSCIVCDGSCQESSGSTSFCGDGTIDAANSETCDDGNTTLEACVYGQQDCLVCDSSCTEVAGATSFCGDGTIDAANSETCDDSNAVSEECAYGEQDCTVCDASCAEVTGATSFCGDDVVDTSNGETCDDGNTTTEKCRFGDDSCTVCDATCQEVAGETSLCGDGSVDSEGGEECDDGNTDDSDGCLSTCLNAVCGDGSLQDGVETCDDGNDDNSDDCLDTCEPNVCGDGYTLEDSTATEDVPCDDGNELDADGCSALCVTEEGWTCSESATTNPTSECEPVSNDGIVVGDEECDDGNDTTGDGCDQGEIEEGFTCDTGMPSSCAPLASCGDGERQSGEECDDGNDATGDGCDATCVIEPGFACDSGAPSTCLADSDGDGVADADDNCPDDGNFNQRDSDSDGIGDACDEDTIEENEGDAVTVASGGGLNCSSTTSTGLGSLFAAIALGLTLARRRRR